MMSGEDDYCDDARLYTCFNKYQQIVKQVLMFDELTDTMDDRSAVSNKGKNINNKNSTKREVMESESCDQVIVKTISKFLADLDATATVDRNTKSSSEDQ